MCEKPKMITYNGVSMVEGWDKQIEKAQKIKTYTFNEGEYDRIKYYNPERPCGDCGVLDSQYHVPSCDIEKCPKCGNQAMMCIDLGCEGDD